MSTVTKTLSAKAQRLAAESKVERVRGHVYRVQGDHDSYIVVVSFPEEVSGACNCPAKGTCSHLIAACAYDLANPVEVNERPAAENSAWLPDWEQQNEKNPT